jgi:hypothetical protein
MTIFIILLLSYLIDAMIYGHWGSRNPRIVRVRNLFAPGYSHCEKCDRAWKFCKEHGVTYNDKGAGTFSLCQECWQESTIEQRKHYMRITYDMQVMQGMADDHYYELMKATEDDTQQWPYSDPHQIIYNPK